MDFDKLATISSFRAAAPERAVSPMYGAIKAQQNALGELHAKITNLEKRLREVLSPSQPQAADKASGPASERPSQLSHVIGENNEALATAIMRLCNIMNRLEI